MTKSHIYFIAAVVLLLTNAAISVWVKPGSILPVLGMVCTVPALINYWPWRKS